MGGTSCDVCVIEEGNVRRGSGREVAGRPLHLPMVDVHTVGAGGGSLGWRDAGGALRVGPRSAGADPGPAAYGRGGTEATVTDANLVLGYLDPAGELAGVELDAEAARSAVERLGEELGLEPTETAAGIVRIANREMVGALRVVTVERGIDPRDHALVSFGGAGGLHAAAIAAELGIERVLCPSAAGVLSAFGLTAGARRRDLARTLMLTEDAIGDGRLAAAVEEIAGRLRGELEGELDAEIEVAFELRYEGQSFELDVGAPDPGSRAGLARGIRGRARAPLRLPGSGSRDRGRRRPRRGDRLAARDRAGNSGAGGRHAAAHDRPGSRARARPRRRSSPARRRPATSSAGPAVIELAETTLLVPPGASAASGPAGIEIRLGEAGPR